MKKKIISIVIVLFLLIAFGTSITVNWLYDTFGHLSLDEIIFHLKVPMEGTNTDVIWQFVKQSLWKILALTSILSFILIYLMKKTEKRRYVAISLCVSTIILVTSISNVVMATDIVTYIQNQKNDSTFIENEYVNPEEANVEFPEEKRNLIYIFLESMETTYYSKEDGGLSEQDLIPEISKLAKENLNFSDTNQLGGAYTPYGTTWTIGAMTAQTAGIPLKLSIERNSLSEYSTFLEGAHTIGEILDDNGYHNFLLVGSDATFGGRRNLFTQHGNYEIWDYISAVEENRISEKVWWGYSDDNLFKFAKEKILTLSENDEPFNFTMLTVDTHFTDGYECEDCQDKWDEKYKNVISCSSKKVGEFINWIQKQDFYDNTTIIISGDHLTMQTNFFDLEEGQEYEKKVVNMIINSAIEAQNTNRKYSTFDLYPTTLAALGATIEGNRLALGTNLFSGELTLIEKYGIKYVDDELMKVSKFYNNNILVSK